MVTPSAVSTYQRDGVMVLRGLLSAAEVESLRDGVEKTLTRPGPLYEVQSAKGDGMFHNDQMMWLRSAVMRDVCLSSGLAVAAQELMTTVPTTAAAVSTNAPSKPGIHLFFDELFVKEPATPTPTPWHNDVSYWQLVPEGHRFQSLSMWCALDDVHHSCAPWYVRGSHDWQTLHSIMNFGGRVSKYAANEQRDSLPTLVDDSVEQQMAAARRMEGNGGENCADSTNVDDDRGSQQRKQDDRDSSMEPVLHPQDDRIVRWNLRAGDVVVHDAWTVHMAPGNASPSRRRRGYVVRYATGEARYDLRPGTMHQWWSSCGIHASLGTGDSLSCSPLFPLVVPGTALPE